MGTRTPLPPVRASPGDEDRSNDDGPVQPDTLISADAIGTLASAILTAGRTLDEQVEMADGLGAVLSARQWLEALAGAAASGNVPAMHVMMGAPGPMPMGMPGLGGLPGGGLPGGGLPGGGFVGVPGGGFPGLPDGFPGGKPKGPGLGRVHPTIQMWSRGFARPRCFHRRTRSAASFWPPPRRRNSATRYGLPHHRAGPGRCLPRYRAQNHRPELRHARLRGVSRHGGANPEPERDEWTDTRIRVIVPDGAGPGAITLSILEASLMRCGQVFTVFRTGGSDVAFEGGTAAVTAFLLDGSKIPFASTPAKSCRSPAT